MLISVVGGAFTVFAAVKQGKIPSSLRGSLWIMTGCFALFFILTVIYAAIVEIKADRQIAELQPEKFKELTRENAKVRSKLASVGAELRNRGLGEIADALKLP